MKLKDFRKHPEISQGRKALYYGGTALTALGLLICFGSMLTLLLSFGEDFGFGTPPQFIWFFAGMVMAMVGGLLQNLGAKGLAGSGTVLDPQRAREDLAPYADALGGLVHDTVQGFKQEQDEGKGPKPESTTIMIRCRACQALNPEQAKYCNQCGQQL